MNRNTNPNDLKILLPRCIFLLKKIQCCYTWQYKEVMHILCFGRVCHPDKAKPIVRWGRKAMDPREGGESRIARSDSPAFLLWMTQPSEKFLGTFQMEHWEENVMSKP
jgi:hypothetical protein